MSPDSQNKFIIVAIDGGAASGKSSCARALSQRYHLMYVDTGSHYRSLSRVLLDHQISHNYPQEVSAFLATLPLKTTLAGREAKLRIPGHQLDPDELRSADVNQSVSHYATLPPVRNALKDYQRTLVEFARDHGFRGIVMEGRDIGSVILPHADFRFFLEADPALREARRQKEGITDVISQRDHIDANRKVAPLAIPRGAFVVDTSPLTLEQVVELLSDQIEHPQAS